MLWKLFRKQKKHQSDVCTSINKDYPPLFQSKEYCCGCSACYAICPVHAIQMEEDAEGFLYPIVNKKICIQCHQCLNVCIFKEKQENKENLKLS